MNASFDVTKSKLVYCPHSGQRQYESKEIECFSGLIQSAQWIVGRDPSTKHCTHAKTSLPQLQIYVHAEKVYIKKQ